MKKRFILLCVITALMCPQAVFADVEVVKLAGNACLINGTASGNETVSVLLTKSATDADNIANAINFCEEAVKDTFNLQIPILEDKMGEDTDLTVYVRVGNGQRKEYNFTYYPESVLNGIIGKLKYAATSDEMNEVLDDNENKELLTAIGFDIDAWENCDKDNAATVFYNNKTILDSDYIEIAEAFEAAVLLSSYKNGDAVEITRRLNKISEIKYEDLTYTDAVKNVDENEICKCIQNSAPYLSFVDLNKAFVKGYAIVDIKAADTYGKVENKLGEYENVLNMPSELYYSYYRSNKTNVAKKMFSSQKKNTVASENDFHELMKTLVTELKNSKNTSGGGSTAGGSSNQGGASQIVAPVVKPSSTGIGNSEALSETQSFSDLSPSHWAFDVVEALHEASVINGYDDGSFKPDKKVTREEFVKMLLSALEIQCTGGSTPFRDCENGQWYSTYVSTAYLKGMVNGLGKNEFGIGKEITRQDIATILFRANDVYPEAVRDYSAFIDAGDISDYAKEAVRVMYEQGVISGSEGYFNPQKSATRAETAMMIYNYINLPEAQLAE